MAIKNYTVKYDQNIFDVALQVYGDASGIGDLLLQNTDLNLGTEIKIGDVLKYDDDNIIDDSIVSYFSTNGIVVANGVGNVYQKETAEDIKMIILCDKAAMRYDWKMSGSGSLFIDWGDNTSIQEITLSDTYTNYSHNMDSNLSDSQDYRKIRIYGDFTLDKLSLHNSNIFKIFAIENFDIAENVISSNSDIDNIGFYDVIQNLSSIDMHGINVDSLTPLISQESLTDLWINDSMISQEALDEYFVGLATGYEDRTPCNVRMWGNTSPSGIYQRPEVLFDPQTGLEAMWVLENERGWIINEIISPPQEDAIIRRFTSKNNSSLIDDIANNDGLIKLPVSQFIAADHSELITSISASSANILEFTTLISEDPEEEQTLIGAKDNDRGVLFSINVSEERKIRFIYGSDEYLSDISLSDGKAHTIKIDASDGYGMKCYIDNAFLHSISYLVANKNYILDSGGDITNKSTLQLSQSFLEDSNRGDNTLSFHLKLVNGVASTSSKIGFLVRLQYDDGAVQYIMDWYYISEGADYDGIVDATVTLHDKVITYYTFGIYTDSITADELVLSDAKLEKGSAPTSWSPAPEDGLQINSPLSVGCLLDSDGIKTNYANALIWNISIGDTVSNIPLPHLGYDIANKEKYVGSNIKEYMIAGGCDYMQVYGAVSRAPNLLLNGYAEKIGYGEDYEYWSEVILDDTLASKKVLLKCQLKVDSLASSNEVYSHVMVYATDAVGVVVGGAMLNLGTSETSYGNFSKEILIPSDASGLKVAAYREPSSSTEGHVYIREVSVTAVDSEYIPNGEDGINLYPLISGDTFISGAEFLNATPFKLDMTSVNDDIWDKRRTDIWDDDVRLSSKYDSAEPKSWYMEELGQQFISDNINDDYKYLLWIKVENGQYKDIFQYGTPLSGDDKDRCNRYVHLNT